MQGRAYHTWRERPSREGFSISVHQKNSNSTSALHTKILFVRVCLGEGRKNSTAKKMENGKWTKQHPILHFKVFSQVNPISPFISTLRHILANAHSHSFNIHWMLSNLSAMKTMVQHLKSSEIKIRKKITNKSKGKTYHLCLFQNLWVIFMELLVQKLLY